jgi:carbon monoxide dehydrogenase subunit G
MAFEVVKTFVVKAPPDRVWQFLIDPHRVAGCLPGAAITGQVDDKTFTGTMTVKVGPVTTSYKGKVVFQRLDAEARVAEVVASGQDVKGKGGANMTLSSTLKEVAPGETEVTAISNLSITGLLAQMGRGMIQDVSDELFQIFSQRVKSELESQGVTPPDTGSPSGSDGRGVEGKGVSPAGSHGGAPREKVARSGEDPSGGEALDLGAIGARAARRAALRVVGGPVFWFAVAVVLALVYWLFIR